MRAIFTPLNEYALQKPINVGLRLQLHAIGNYRKSHALGPHHNRPGNHGIVVVGDDE